MAEQSIYDEHFYVVCDSLGFVGAYKEANMVITLRNKYAPTPFIVHRFRLRPGVQQDEVWNVLYKANDMVAFASNDREEAKTALEAYNELGLSYEDDIDYWRQPLNKINVSAEERLNSIKKAHEMYMAGTLDQHNEEFNKEMEKINKLLEPSKFSPIERFIKENERITIFDCVVPVSLTYAADAADTDAAAAADNSNNNYDPAPIDNVADDGDSDDADDGTDDCDGAIVGLTRQYSVAVGGADNADQHNADDCSTQQKQDVNQQDQHNDETVSSSDPHGSTGGLITPEIDTNSDESQMRLSSEESRSEDAHEAHDNPSRESCEARDSRDARDASS
jgi:hypothetical protein